MIWQRFITSTQHTVDEVATLHEAEERKVLLNDNLIIMIYFNVCGDSSYVHNTNTINC